MQIVRTFVLYAALAGGAIAAANDSVHAAASQDVKALAVDTLAKIRFHDEPQAVTAVGFASEDGAEVTLENYRGKYVLVNFWALWCAPCREEMPALNALDAQLGGDSFEVVTIATGRNALPAIHKFFDEHAIEDLPILLDPKMAMARDAGALGLPMSLLIDPTGKEVARVAGELVWDSPEAIAFFKAWIGDDVENVSN